MRISVFSFIVPLLLVAPLRAMGYDDASASDSVVATHRVADVMVQAKSKTQKLREGAYAVNAIDVKSLANMTISLNEILGRTAGVKVRAEGGVGSDFDLSVNGMSGNSVRYFIDGIPLDAMGSRVNLANLPVDIVDRVEIFKGVVPTSLGSDALGGAVNIITKRSRNNYFDASYSVGSFYTHQINLNAQFSEKKSGLVFRPTLSVDFSENNYTMRDMEVPSVDGSFQTTDCERFHDDFLSVFGKMEVGVVNKPWADELFLFASYSKVDKELQTGAVQTRVYGMAERQTRSTAIGVRYRKDNIFAEGLSLSASLSHTWDHSQTVDTAARKYYWNGTYIPSSRNEINGRFHTWRHYLRPLTIGRFNADYALDDNHSFNLNYALNRTGNKQRDDVDKAFEPSNDVLFKHVLGLSYNQMFFDERLSNSFFVKNYTNHLEVNQSDLSFITNSDKVESSSTENYWGYGLASRFKFCEPFAVKSSYEHSVRLPLSRELLGNGTTIYANMALRPESSDNFNVGVFGSWRFAPKHTIYYETNGFLRLVDDYIQARVSEKEGMMQYENVPAVHIKGVEGELRYVWDNRLQMSFNGSWQDSRDQRKYKDDGKLSATYKNRTPNRPWLFCNAEAAYTFHNVVLPESKLRIGVDYQWVHWFFLTWEAYGADATKARIPEQKVANLSLQYSWCDSRYNVTLDCTNLFDELAYDNYKLQKPGRAFYAKFRLMLR